MLHNSFSKGMGVDFDPVVQPEGTYRIAVNAVTQSNDEIFDGLTNEESNIKSFSVPGTAVGYTYIQEHDKFLIFSHDGASIIGWGDPNTNEYEEIVRDSDYGCDWGFKDCEWLYAEYKYMQPCTELWIYWSSDCFYWRAPISILLDPKRKDELKCDDFKLFQCVCAPNVITSVSDKGGFDLVDGIYQFSAQLEDSDGNTTNWFFVNQPVSIEGEKNQAGEHSTNSIKVTLQDLDKRYNKVNIAVIRTIGGVTTASKIATKYYNTASITFVYAGNPSQEQDISIDEILIKQKKYIRGRDLIQKDNRLYLYNLRQENNLNYQTKALKISTKWKAYRVPQQDAKRFKSMMRDEVYAFGIVWNYCDGTHSAVFHIPAGNCDNNGTACIECNTAPVNEWSPCPNGGGDSNTACEQVQNQGNIPAGGTGGERSQSIVTRFGCDNAIPIEIDSGFTGSYKSTEIYPLTKDCDGNYIYGDRAGKPITHHHLPPTSTIPHFVSTSNGVPNKYQMGSDEWLDTDVILLGMEFSGIEFPDPKELPKPLCPNSPYKIVYVERTQDNKSIIAKGMFINTFNGNIHGKTYVFGKVGVNSNAHVDRMIVNGEDDSKFGDTAPNASAQLFYSPDTTMDTPPLPVSAVKTELKLYGSGWRHGLYAKGKAPQDIYKSRIDQRGTRQAVNLNHYVPDTTHTCVSGVTYAQDHRITINPAGVSNPLCNIYRESSVYIQGTNPFPSLENGLYEDLSFVGDGMVHEAPIPYAAANYGSLKRSFLNQYGSVVNLSYIDLGLNCGANNATTISGPCGDSSIGLFTVRRTSYVSNKVSEHHEDGKEPEPQTNGLLKYLGMVDCEELPVSDDDKDYKNFANLHPELLEPITTGKSGPFPTSDVYYPRVQKTLISFWVESDVDVHFRGSGTKEIGEVFYPKLQGFELDSEVPGNTNWEDSYLNRFYCEIRRTSKWKLATLAAVRAFVNLLPATMFATDVLDVESAPDMGFVGIEALSTTMIWVVLNFMVFTSDNIKRLLGIDDCNPDRRDGKYDESVVGFEDNYYSYNQDHSRNNVLNIHTGVPDPYNTCICTDCCTDSTNEVYYSNTQAIDSPIDAYRNFQSFSYVAMPANAGRLTKMFVVNGQMYGMTSDGLYVMRYATQANTSLLENQLTGDASLLSDPIRFFEGIQEGSFGTLDPNASINTLYGFFFIDTKANIVYRFDGQSPKAIMDVSTGMEKFFYRHLPFCNERDCCTDEKRKTYYTMGYDPDYNRILLTKHDEKISWTMSYDPLTNKWISMHSYTPQFYMWNRNKLFSMYNNTAWKHNSTKGEEYQTFYGTYHPFIVEFAAHQDNTQPFQFDSTMMDSQADIKVGDSWVKDRNITFNKATYHNNTESSGILNLTVRDDYSGAEEDLQSKMLERGKNIEVVRESRQWRINEVYNFLTDNNAPLTLKDKCNPIHEINDAVCDPKVLQEQTYRNRVLFDRYLINRFTFDNPIYRNVRLNLRSVLTQVEDQRR